MLPRTDRPFAGAMQGTRPHSRYSPGPGRHRTLRFSPCRSFLARGADQAAGSRLMRFRSSQFSPTAIMQVRPAVLVISTVQEPVLET